MHVHVLRVSTILLRTGIMPYLLNVRKNLVNGERDDSRVFFHAHHSERLSAGGLPVRKHSPYMYTQHTR